MGLRIVTVLLGRNVSSKEIAQLSQTFMVFPFLERKTQAVIAPLKLQ